MLTFALETLSSSAIWFNAGKYMDPDIGENQATKEPVRIMARFCGTVKTE